MKYHTKKQHRVLPGDIVVTIILILVVIFTLYPIVYIFSMSISAPSEVAKRSVWLLPKGRIHFGAYKDAFYTQELLRSYKNTIWYTAVGTLLSVIFTMTLAYPMSRRTFGLRKIINMMAVITMFFSGGMIPTFIIVNQLRLYNTRWAMVLPSVINTFNLVIARTFLEDLPNDINEAAYIDGANDIRIFLGIVLPLSMPLVAVLTLYYAVSYWNSYFTALLYLPDSSLQPMQIYLRKILIEAASGKDNLMQTGDSFGANRAMKIEQMKYSLVIISTLPIILVYPFLQKYFVKGVMIGAIKE